MIALDADGRVAVEWTDGGRVTRTAAPFRCPNGDKNPMRADSITLVRRIAKGLEETVAEERRRLGTSAFRDRTLSRRPRRLHGPVGRIGTGRRVRGLSHPGGPVGPRCERRRQTTGGTPMKTLLVCTSVSHGNTRRVARAMAGVLDARVVAPQEVTPEEVAEHDLVGFGSGVFAQRMHPDLLRFVRALPPSSGRAFVFATSGLPELAFAPFTRPLVRLLAGRGRAVEATFTCRGFDTWAPFRLIGGINKQRPDADDLSAARAFARRLLA
ncbi:flavodoxin family protein [Streptomyces sp. NRRL S-378]|uniref:flavodoxin family protein n=1 Tax=Streptomyces sp. NRRL S-378 TaxID=1463904 RepID=UPI000A674F6F|nr:flavodoxin family protein [Streptomyces sp. NRRL S-378]